MPLPSAQVYRRELSYRVGVLLDLHELETGDPLTFVEIADQLKSRFGITLSRSRWGFIISGTGNWVKDPELLGSLSQVLGEAPEYLADLKASVASERVTNALPAVVEKRQKQLLGVAARSLGEIAPETYSAIARTIKADLERLAVERQLSAEE